MQTNELATSKDEERQCPDQEYADSPESPDPSLISDVFVVERHNAPEITSITSSDIVEFVRQATEDDAYILCDSSRPIENMASKRAAK